MQDEEVSKLKIYAIHTNQFHANQFTKLELQTSVLVQKTKIM